MWVWVGGVVGPDDAAIEIPLVLNQTHFKWGVPQRKVPKSQPQKVLRGVLFRINARQEPSNLSEHTAI